MSSPTGSAVVRPGPCRTRPAVAPSSGSSQPASRSIMNWPGTIRWAIVGTRTARDTCRGPAARSRRSSLAVRPLDRRRWAACNGLVTWVAPCGSCAGRRGLDLSGSSPGPARLVAADDRGPLGGSGFRSGRFGTRPAWLARSPGFRSTGGRPRSISLHPAVLVGVLGAGGCRPARAGRPWACFARILRRAVCRQAWCAAQSSRNSSCVSGR